MDKFEYKDWLLPEPSNNTKAKCRLCMRSFSLSNMGESALKRYVQGKKHQNAVKTSGKNTSVWGFLKKDDQKASTSRGIKFLFFPIFPIFLCTLLFFLFFSNLLLFVLFFSHFTFNLYFMCNEITITVHFNVTQWFLAIFMEHRLNTAFSVAQFIVVLLQLFIQECS